MTAPFTPEQEARLRALMREEIIASDAMRNSRDAVEYAAAYARLAASYAASEFKRSGADA